MSDNWRSRSDGIKRCRYCKKDGHLIKQCPTRPKRAKDINRRYASEPDTVPKPAPKKKLPGEMHWPDLGGKKVVAETKTAELRGRWGKDKSIVDKINNPPEDDDWEEPIDPKASWAVLSGC